MNTHCGFGVQWNSLVKPTAFAQLVARGGQQRREPRLRRAFAERHALLAKFRPTVVICIQHHFCEDRIPVHYLLP